MLDKLPSFKGICLQFEQKIHEWKNFYIAAEPEKCNIPFDLPDITDLQKMLILRCLRPDRMIHAISSFVSKHLGAVFVNPPPFDLK